MGQYEGIKSPTPQDELDYIEGLCKKYFPIDNCHTSVAIEIGSAQGASTVMFARYFDVIIAIDPYGREIIQGNNRIASYVDSPATHENLRIFLKNIESRGLAFKVFPIIGTPDILWHLPPINADLIFVDNGHTYDDCHRDLLLAYKHISSQGLVIVHDHLRDGRKWAYIGVEKAVAEVMDKGMFERVALRSGVITIRRSGA